MLPVTIDDAVREAARAARERHPALEIQLSRRGGPTAQGADARTTFAFDAVFDELARTARAVVLSVEVSAAGALITVFAAGAPAEAWDVIGRVVREGGGRVAIRRNPKGATAFLFWGVRAEPAPREPLPFP